MTPQNKLEGINMIYKTGIIIGIYKISYLILGIIIVGLVIMKIFKSIKNFLVMGEKINNLTENIKFSFYILDENVNKKLDLTNEKIDTIDVNVNKKLDLTNEKINTLGVNVYRNIEKFYDDLNIRFDSTEVMDIKYQLEIEIIRLHNEVENLEKKTKIYKLNYINLLQRI